MQVQAIEKNFFQFLKFAKAKISSNTVLKLEYSENIKLPGQQMKVHSQKKFQLLVRKAIFKIGTNCQI